MDPKSLTRSYLDEAHAMETALVTNLSALSPYSSRSR